MVRTKTSLLLTTLLLFIFTGSTNSKIDKFNNLHTAPHKTNQEEVIFNKFLVTSKVYSFYASIISKSSEDMFNHLDNDKFRASIKHFKQNKQLLDAKSFVKSVLNPSVNYAKVEREIYSITIENLPDSLLSAKFLLKSVIYDSNGKYQFSLTTKNQIIFHKKGKNLIIHDLFITPSISSYSQTLKQHIINYFDLNYRH